MLFVGFFLLESAEGEDTARAKMHATTKMLLIGILQSECSPLRNVDTVPSQNGPSELLDFADQADELSVIRPTPPPIMSGESTCWGQSRCEDTIGVR